MIERHWWPEDTHCKQTARCGAAFDLHVGLAMLAIQNVACQPGLADV